MTFGKETQGRKARQCICLIPVFVTYTTVSKAYCQVALTIQHLGGESEAAKQILTLVPDPFWKPRFTQRTHAEMRGERVKVLTFPPFLSAADISGDET